MHNAEINKTSLLILIALCLGWTLIYADRTALYPLLSVIGKDFNLSATLLGTITGSYFLVYVAMQIPSGMLADKIGKKKLLIITFFIAGVALLGFGLFARSYILLLLFTALHGLGAGAFYPCAYGIMLNTVDSKISDKFGRKKIALMLFPLGAFTIFLMTYARSPFPIILSLVAYGIVGKSSWDPIAVAWAGRHAAAIDKDALGTAMGMFNFVGMMSAVVAPVVTGYIRDITGSLVTAYYVAAAMSILGGCLVMFIKLLQFSPDNLLHTNSHKLPNPL
ncbi:MAG: MFS transporter [Thermovenabulum sp.]|uniref:MFS transporter n=1 Tax=Thermovenabulum sp. TaxID=3100335 RepID=UPI003C7E7570